MLREDRREEFLSAMRRVVFYAPLHGSARYNLALDALTRGETALAREHAEAGLRASYEFPPGFLEALGLTQESRE